MENVSSAKFTISGGALSYHKKLLGSELIMMHIQTGTLFLYKYNIFTKFITIEIGELTKIYSPVEGNYHMNVILNNLRILYNLSIKQLTLTKFNNITNDHSLTLLHT